VPARIGGKVHTNGNYYYVPRTINDIKTALATYGPLTTTFTVYSDFFSYRSGVYTYTSGTYQGGHAVLIVGYDDPGQYFIVKNSWGTGWGEAGFFRIAYSEVSGGSRLWRSNLCFFRYSSEVTSITVELPMQRILGRRGTDSPSHY